jgi:hypothetical protein
MIWTLEKEAVIINKNYGQDHLCQNKQRYIANMQKVKKFPLADIWELNFRRNVRDSQQIHTVRKELNPKQISKSTSFTMT